MLEGEAGAWCPYGQPGDRLWVRESIAGNYQLAGHPVYRAEAVADDSGERDGWWVRESQWSPEMFLPNPVKWKSPLHMPRRASRLALEVVEVRVERVQEITGEDAFAEGVQVPVSEGNDTHARPLLRLTGPVSHSEVSPKPPASWDGNDFARFEFANLWDTINAKRGHPWDANPWVWAITFRPVEAPHA
jgi:hypothetical protein